MSWDADWTDLMPHSVTVKAQSAIDGYGKQTWDSGTAYTARVVKKQRRIRTFAGEEALAQGEVWIKSLTAFDPTDDQLTVPAGFFSSTTPPVIGSEQLVDEGGVIGLKLYIG